MTIIQKNNVVLVSSFENQIIQKFGQNSENKTVNLEKKNCTRNLKPPMTTQPDRQIGFFLMFRILVVA